MGIRCLAISCVTNMAAGILPEPIDAEHVLAVGAAAQGRLTALLREVLPGTRCDAAVALHSARAASLRELPSVDRVLADPRLAERPATARARRGARALERARAAIRARRRARGIRRARARRACRGAPAVAAPRAQRDGRARPHEPRPRAARSGRARPRRRGRGRVLQSRVRPRRAAPADRGRITSHALLRRITGAEAALVVNNNAAAVLLALAALAEGREVLVSRGELIEIGDGFRIPDVLARSGARLVEVGTTNRTRAADYERAIGPETARRCCACTSRTSGSSASPSSRARRARRRRARAHGLPLVDDLGSGALSRSRRRADRRPAASPPAPISSASRATSCSAGRRPGSSSAAPTRRAAAPAPAAARAARRQAHPRRARGHARVCARPGAGAAEIPVLRMLDEPVEAVRARAERLAGLVGGEVEETVARVGGGASAGRARLASPVRSRRRSSGGCGSASRRSSASSATGGCCSTPRASRDDEWTRWRAPSRPLGLGEPPRLPSRLRAGETLLGAWCSLPTPGAAELLAAGGVDHVVVDLQHGLASEGDLTIALSGDRGARCGATRPGARERPGRDRACARSRSSRRRRPERRFGRGGGARQSLRRCTHLVARAATARCGPALTLGVRRARGGRGDRPDRVRRSGRTGREHRRSRQASRRSTSARWDLSVSLGLPVPPDLDGSALADAIARVRAAADAAGLPAGVHSIRAADAARLAAAGWRLVNVADDATLLLSDGVADGARAQLASAEMALTVGTAGHIDHGKTWLVRALDRQGHRPAAGGAAARDLDRPRLRTARAARRPPALARRRAGARALRPHDGRRRDRDRPVPARDRRCRGRATADARAPRDPAAARRRAPASSR